MNEEAKTNFNGKWRQNGHIYIIYEHEAYNKLIINHFGLRLLFIGNGDEGEPRITAGMGWDE